jgi:endonuclease YncB( thermonuclease family)
VHAPGLAQRTHRPSPRRQRRARLKVSAARASATAIAGDTLRLGRQLIRLQGIDAPELEQQCQDKKRRPWPCGREAHAHLAGLLSRGLVSCAIAGNDRYGPALATCSTDLIGDVGEAMVRAGFASNFIGWRYLLVQTEARIRKRGVWRGSFERPPLGGAGWTRRSQA